MAELRFCAYQYQHLPMVELRERWRRAEELGFDVMWNVDTVVEPDRERHPIFDGPATLVDLALSTSAIRVGTLHGAYASFEERHKGSIEAGKLADLVVLGRDPLREDPSTLVTVPVERTMAGGRWVFEA